MDTVWMALTSLATCCGRSALRLVLTSDADTEALLGPHVVLQVPGIRDEGVGLTPAGVDVDVLVVDVSEGVSPGLFKFADAGVREDLLLGFHGDVSIVPDLVQLQTLVSDWLGGGGDQRMAFYSAESEELVIDPQSYTKGKSFQGRRRKGGGSVWSSCKEGFNEHSKDGGGADQVNLGFAPSDGSTIGKPTDRAEEDARYSSPARYGSLPEAKSDASHDAASGFYKDDWEPTSLFFLIAGCIGSLGYWQSLATRESNKQHQWYCIPKESQVPIHYDLSHHDWEPTSHKEYVDEPPSSSSARPRVTFEGEHGFKLGGAGAGRGTGTSTSWRSLGNGGPGAKQGANHPGGASSSGRSPPGLPGYLLGQFFSRGGRQRKVAERVIQSHWRLHDVSGSEHVPPTSTSLSMSEQPGGDGEDRRVNVAVSGTVRRFCES